MKGRMVMEKLYFSVNGVEYIVQHQPGGTYKEIVEKETGRRAKNQKQVCRDYGIDVSTDPRIMNTHQAIEKLINKLPREPVSGFLGIRPPSVRIKRVTDKKDRDGLQARNIRTVFTTAKKQADAGRCSNNGANKLSKNDDILSGGKMKNPPVKDKTLACNGAAYTFKETMLHFDGNTYSNVFCEKNNKTLAQTINGEKYRHLEEETRTCYSGYLNEKLGSFLKQLKENGDLFYTRFLNKYGDSVYSRFYINDTELLSKKGLYAYCVKDDLKYIGKTITPFGKRINDGYGRISPKNCYLDGQATNCHVNSLITKHKDHIRLLLLPLENDSFICKLEKALINTYYPEWNIQK
jgi:hypothetical protein